MKTICALMLLFGGSVAHAETFAPALEQSARPSVAADMRPSDSLIVAGQADTFSTGHGGGGASLDWVRASVNGTTLTAGVSSFSIGDSHWSFGRVGGAIRPDERTIVQGQASLGSGRTAGSPFAYRLFNVGLSYLASTATYIKAEDQFVDIGATHGHLLKAGALFLPLTRLSADISYAHSVSGNLNSEFAAARVDWQTEPARLLGGLAWGRSAPDLLNIDVGSGNGDHAFREFFVGMAIPVSGLELMAVADFVNLDTGRKRTLTLSLKIPLGGT
jgi:hypothetical protein